MTTKRTLALMGTDYDDVPAPEVSEHRDRVHVTATGWPENFGAGREAVTVTLWLTVREAAEFAGALNGAVTGALITAAGFDPR
jgi:hypothetical protein